jgi:REP element-mobilizing transposase RayT
MARKVRVEFEGATYHVMCRGDRRENIFEDDLDRARFLETLGEVCRRTGWKIRPYGRWAKWSKPERKPT